MFLMERMRALLEANKHEEYVSIEVDDLRDLLEKLDDLEQEIVELQSGESV